MKSKQEILEKLSAIKQVLCEKYPISSLALFGSFARNEQTEFSDVDIMVEFHGKVGSRFIELANELERMLGVKVDLVSKKGIKERYIKVIQPDLLFI